MKRSAFDSTRDQYIADETALAADLMCRAHGCPNRWSVECGDAHHLCSAHAWVEDKSLWPQITAEQQDAETERARANALPKPAPHHYTDAEKTEILRRLARVGKPVNPKEWAYRLKYREMQGERLTQAQRQMWRAAIQEPPSDPD